MVDINDIKNGDKIISPINKKVFGILTIREIHKNSVEVKGYYGKIPISKLTLNEVPEFAKQLSATNVIYCKYVLMDRSDIKSES